MTSRSLALLLLTGLCAACGSGSSDAGSSAGPATGNERGSSASGGGSTEAGGATSEGGGEAGGSGGTSGGAASMAGGGQSAGDSQNACCSEGTTPGCADAAVESCICGIRPECCSGAWDAACVALVDEKHCEPSVRACVCEDWQQAACCDDTWDTFCKITAEEKCGAEPACVDPLAGTPPGQNTCCETSTAPGCSDSLVEQCVCAQLPDCCTNAWDSVCVELVRQQTCAPDVRTCVCEEWQQSGCCDTDWTDFCSITAEEKCGAQTTCP